MYLKKSLDTTPLTAPLTDFSVPLLPKPLERKGREAVFVIQTPAQAYPALVLHLGVFFAR
jgi:hypothetical protein